MSGRDETGALGARSHTTARFARQHEQLQELSKVLLKTLDTRTLTIDPGPARRALATFVGRLRVHAAMEQEALYPRLLASSDPAVAAKARELFDEVGTLYDRFFSFLDRWSDPEVIKANAEGFCRETMMELHRLSRRLRRENDELYPMVDALERGNSRERSAPFPAEAPGPRGEGIREGRGGR